jgi:hypothetical protein
LIFSCEGDCWGEAPAQKVLSVLEDQITIGAGGIHPNEKPARPAQRCWPMAIVAWRRTSLGPNASKSTLRHQADLRLF